jgi:DNA polymerase III subunit delta'
MAQALLLIGPPHVGVYSFAHRLAAMLLCHAESKPCGECDSCHLLRAGTHPDCQSVRPEAEGGVIKIDQIRALQDEVYHTPQCGQRLVILIEHADKMNVASANALLKMLEEPPSYVHFILGAEQLSSMPATILSRCQRMVFPDLCHDSSNYIALGEHYPAESNRARLYAKRQSMIISLCEIIDGQTSPCTVAAQWTDFHLADLVWLLYLILAQAMQIQLLNVQHIIPDNEAVYRFARLRTPVALLNHIDKIHLISKKLSHNISINATLALEHLLTDFVLKVHHDR